MPLLPSNRNQSIDLLRKSIDRFLYEGNTGIHWVKPKYSEHLTLWSAKKKMDMLIINVQLKTKYFSWPGQERYVTQILV